MDPGFQKQDRGPPSSTSPKAEFSLRTRIPKCGAHNPEGQCLRPQGVLNNATTSILLGFAFQLTT